MLNCFDNNVAQQILNKFKNCLNNNIYHVLAQRKMAQDRTVNQVGAIYISTKNRQ